MQNPISNHFRLLPHKIMLFSIRSESVTFLNDTANILFRMGAGYTYRTKKLSTALLRQFVAIAKFKHVNGNEKWKSGRKSPVNFAFNRFEMCSLKCELTINDGFYSSKTIALKALHDWCMAIEFISCKSSAFRLDKKQNSSVCVLPSSHRFRSNGMPLMR